MAKITQTSYKTVYKCHDCGSTSYQPVIARAQNGALLPTGQYRCTGCHSVFATVRSWWMPRVTPDFQVSRHYG